MLTQLLSKYGFTRDSATWVYAQLVGVAALVIANVGNLSGWFTYVGINLSDVNVHRISVLAAVILYFGGKYGSSPLQGAPKA
jgi:hypothetical protein